MAMFKFRLASVLRVREHKKEEKQWELRALYDTWREMVTEIEALERELAEGGTAPAEGQIFTALELRLLGEYGQSLAKRIKAKRITLARLDANIAEKRGELAEAVRAVKSLEKLRARYEQRYWREQNAAQQRLSDEIARRKYVQPENRKKIPS
ncbi:MAG: flagellar export protein FliJ [Candidatus Binatia bacterium]